VSGARLAAGAVLAARVGYGAALVVSPERLTRRWLGPSVSSAPVAVPLRALGVREAILHAGALAAVVRGQPIRPWLAGSIAGDLADIASTALGRRELPPDAAKATALVAGASAAISAAVGAAVDA
jgi:hypothetical protein